MLDAMRAGSPAAGLRVGVIGTGCIGLEHLRNLKAGSAVPGESAANADSQVASEGLMFSMDAEESSDESPSSPS